MRRWPRGGPHEAPQAGPFRAISEAPLSKEGRSPALAPRIARFITVAAVLLGLTLARSALAQPLTLIEEVAAKPIIDALAPTLEPDLSFHVFEHSSRLYLYDEPHGSLYEVHAGTLDDAPQVTRCEDLLLGREASIGIYGKAAETDFIARARLSSTDSLRQAFLVIPDQPPQRLIDVVSSTGQSARVSPVDGYPLLQRFSSSMRSSAELVDSLRRSPLKPQQIHILLYYQDTHVEDSLAQLGIDVRVVPGNDPEEILRVIRSGQRRDLFVILSHSEHGHLRIPGSKMKGLSQDALGAEIRKSGNRVLSWGCETGMALNGPRHVVYIDDAVGRLVQAVKATNMLDFIAAMKDEVVVDESLIETEETDEGAAAAHKLRRILNPSWQAQPGLVLPPRQPEKAPTGFPRNDRDAAAESADAAAAAPPHGAVSAVRPLNVDGASTANDSLGARDERTWPLNKAFLLIGGAAGVVLLYTTMRPRRKSA